MSVKNDLNLIKHYKPQYKNIHDWEFYASNLLTEYKQSIDEGLDICEYKDIFEAVAKLEKGEVKKRFGDIIFDMVANAPQAKNYKYTEPSDLCSIRKLRKPFFYQKKPCDSIENKISGAWYGRICGCLLGKTVEGIRTDELTPFLKETDNFPMHRYILRSDINDDIVNKYKFGFSGRCYADKSDGMPVDDDTNYTVLYQELISKCGLNFTPSDVANLWLQYQGKDAYCTAERVAFCNFVKGFAPPESAVYKNPYREWIGAQIRADYFGYINPGNPELAAEMAWKDASVSHIKNGIYGEMFVAAMIAIAAVTDNIQDIIAGGLAQIPCTSRLYEEISQILDDYNAGVSKDDCFKKIHSKYDEYTDHGWCHTISNAMIVVSALLYGNGDYGKSVCMAVETGFDTDCNAATVGSILGMANGINSIDSYWTKPINDKLHTSLFGLETVKISDRIQLTLKHISANEYI